MISVLIPTMDNLDYLKLCVRSIHENTNAPYQIMVWDNGSTDGSEEWCKTNLPGLDPVYRRVDENVGISIPFNWMAENAKFDLIFPGDNDYYFLPGWDTVCAEAAKYRWRSPMQIRRERPTRGIVATYGGHPSNFREQDIKDDFAGKVYPHRRVATFFPCVMWRQDWLDIGGYSEDFMIDEQSFLWRAYTFYKELGITQLTCPTSYIYHFAGITRRPAGFGVEVMNSRHQAEVDFGMSEDEMDGIMNHFAYYGPSLDAEAELIDYGVTQD